MKPAVQKIVEERTLRIVIQTRSCEGQCVTFIKSKNDKNKEIDMSKRKTSIFSTSQLPILAALQAMANDMVRDYGEEVEGEPLEYYGENYMESLSEAGYTECRPNDRLSLRAFARLIRVKRDDLSVLKNTLGYRPGSTYHDFAISDNVVTALSRNTDLAPALLLLAPDSDAKSVGPFYPKRTSFDVAAALKARADYAEVISNLAAKHGASGKGNAVDTAVVELASIFKVAGLEKVAKDFKSAGVNDTAALQVCVAHAALTALRNEARLTQGLRSVQPEKKSENSDSE